MNLPSLPFSLWILIVLILIGAWALFQIIRTGALVVERRIHWVILALRILGFSALILAILNPFWRTMEPDPKAYSMAVLVDASASMETRDLPDETSRLEWVARWLDPDNATAGLKTLADAQTPVEVHLFSSETLAWDQTPVEKPIPGQTAIGNSLEAIQAQGSADSRRPLGGVLLISDGAHLTGRNPANVAADYKQEGIPVSVIGVGQQRESGDVVVEFTQPKLSLTEGKQASIEIKIENSFSSVDSGQLSVYRNDILTEQRNISLEAGETQTAAIEINPGSTGVETFRAVYTPTQTRGNPATNISYSIADVEHKGQYRYLLLSGSAGWEARFLRLLAMESEIIQMDSLIRIDEGRFISLTHPDGESSSQDDVPADRRTLDTIPDKMADYLSYDAIILDLPILLEESETLAPILKEFSGTKGGGLLLIHSGNLAAEESQIPGALRELFPARDFSVKQFQNPLTLELEVNPLFSDQAGGILFSNPPPVIPGESIVSVPSTLSRAAQVHATTQPEQLPVLVTHAYGAGRAAWLGTDFLWRWRLGDERSSKRFNAFWEANLSWLAVGGKDRLVSPVNATMVPVEEETSLEVRLLGADFTPRMDAMVTAILTHPGGEISKERLLPDIEEPGRYTLTRPLNVPGAYQIEYEALFPDGDRLTKTSWFAVAATSPESRETAFREKTLRDIARITGGEYRSFDNWEEMTPLPVSQSIPLVESRFHWTRSLPFLLVAMSLFLIEWWVRRRNGLR